MEIYDRGHYAEARGKVTGILGLHARPITGIVETLTPYGNEVYVYAYLPSGKIKGPANGKNPLQLFKLVAVQDSMLSFWFELGRNVRVSDVSLYIPGLVKAVADED
jgi:phosphotransferase system HPr-like phosphotransfer protein